MLAILAEDDTDVDVLTVLIRRIAAPSKIRIKGKGFKGSGNLRKDAARQIDDFLLQGVSRFIICHDSDGPDPEAVRKDVTHSIGQRILKRCVYAIIVPVQELEAWIIADEEAIAAVIPSLKIKPESQPETIDNPKEWLISKSPVGKSKARYVPTIHNANVASHLDIAKVQRKCPSFDVLVKFVEGK